MEEILKIISGVCWSLTYIILIKNGFKYKTYGMPFFALALNLSWEFIYSFYQFDPSNISLQRGINILWLLLDVVLLYQYFKYGIKEFVLKNNKLFYLWSIAVLVICFVVELLFLQEFGRNYGAKYSAFLQNLIMSILFIDLIYKRKTFFQSSLRVAVLKWIGTLAPTILFGWDNYFILVIGILCSFFDIVYICTIYFYRNKVVKLRTSNLDF